MKGVLVLLAVDPNSIYLLRRYAEEGGFRAVNAGGVEEALALAKLWKPAGIVLEAGLPGINARDAIRRLKTEDLTRNVPVVVYGLSDEDPAGSLGSSLSDGPAGQTGLVAGYLQYPVLFDNFIAVLGRAGIPRRQSADTGLHRQKGLSMEKASPNGKRTLLDVKNLKKHFPIQRGFLLTKTVGYVKAVDGVSFTIREGETLGLVGESGCGKTTAGRMILRAYEPTAGEIWFGDRALGKVNVPELDPGQLKQMRRNMQLIFQDPYSSLNPRMTLLQIVGEPLLVNRVARGKELEDRVAELLKVVGLRPEYMSRYPHAFSGGQRQRIGVARALALHPQLIICDEPVSALDVSIQAQTLNLLLELQKDYGLTYLFISHDLSVVEHISDRVAVMYVGKLVENAPTSQLFLHPRHPYTEALLSAVPKPDPRLRVEPIELPGEVADPAHPPSGCYFHPRCRYCMDICRTEEPVLREIRSFESSLPGQSSGEHTVSCHRAEELTLLGVTGK